MTERLQEALEALCEKDEAAERFTTQLQALAKRVRQGYKVDKSTLPPRVTDYGDVIEEVTAAYKEYKNGFNTG